jgi:molybdopterin biosynthesis enzyme
MRTLFEILGEQVAFRLNNTQKGIIASVAVSATPEIAYGVITGARNTVESSDELERLGYIEVNDETKTATLTQRGQEVLRAENLTDDMGELTDRGEEILARFRKDKDDWLVFEFLNTLTSK